MFSYICINFLNKTKDWNFLKKVNCDKYKRTEVVYCWTRYICRQYEKSETEGLQSWLLAVVSLDLELELQVTFDPADGLGSFFTVRLLGTMREEVTESKHAIEIFRKKKTFQPRIGKRKKKQCDQIHGPETLTAFHDTTQPMMAIYPFGTARPHPRPPVRLPTPHPATTSTSTSSFLWVPLPQSAISSPLLLLIPVSCFSFHLHLVSSMFPIPSSKYMHGSIKQYKCS